MVIQTLEGQYYPNKKLLRENRSWHTKTPPGRPPDGVLENGAQGRNRTTDTAIFSRMLYQLSYLGVLSLAPEMGTGKQEAGL